MLSPIDDRRQASPGGAGKGPTGRIVLGLADSLNFTIRERKPRLITPQGKLWLHRSLGATVLVETSPAMNPEQLDAKNINYYFYDYRPRPGDTIIDVGAGAGTELLTSCRLVGPSGRVVAVEARKIRARKMIRELRSLGYSVERLPPPASNPA